MICAVVNVNANDHSVISSNLPMLYEVNQPTSNVVVYRGRNVELAIPKLFKGYSSTPKAPSYDRAPTTDAPETKPTTVKYSTPAPTYPTTTTTTARPVYKPTPTKAAYTVTTQASQPKYSNPENTYNTYSGTSYGHGNVHSSYPATTYHQQPHNLYNAHNTYDYAPVRKAVFRKETFVFKFSALAFQSALR